MNQTLFQGYRNNARTAEGGSVGGSNSGGVRGVDSLKIFGKFSPPCLWWIQDGGEGRVKGRAKDDSKMS